MFYLTLTRVVFEYKIFKHNSVSSMYLTLTRVVFEYKGTIRGGKAVILFNFNKSCI